MPDRFPRSLLVNHENPLWMNERLIVQQGVFLCPGDISASFQKNLCELSENIPDLKPWYKEEGLNGLPKLNVDNVVNESNLIKIIMPMGREILLDLLDKLQRMNITEATLFPGLDGFARSLKQSLPRLHDVAERRLKP